jgi:acetyl esterase/lipase
MMGSRSSVPKQLQELCEKNSYVLVSLDYRLVPQAKLPEIIADLKDGLNWVRKSGPKLFGAGDAKMLVAGASAGGYLAMMSGIVIEPAPTAIVSYWGFGDVDGKWTTTPNKNYRKGKLIGPKEAWKEVGKDVLSSTDRDNGRAQAKLFIYLKQQGLWGKVASGFDPKTEREKLKPYCPIRNLSKSYPPLMMLHGTDDADVPYAKSVEMAKALKKLGQPYELLTIANGGHGLWGGNKKQIREAHVRSIAFMRNQLGTP